MKHYFPPYLPKGSKSAKYPPQIYPAHLLLVDWKLFMQAAPCDGWVGARPGCLCIFLIYFRIKELLHASCAPQIASKDKI